MGVQQHRGRARQARAAGRAPREARRPADTTSTSSGTGCAELPGDLVGTRRRCASRSRVGGDRRDAHQSFEVGSDDRQVVLEGGPHRHGVIGLGPGSAGHAADPTWPSHLAAVRVIFVEPAFPANQREFVRGLAEAGAEVIGVGERPEDHLDDQLRSWMVHYHQVPNVTDVGVMTDAVRWIQDQGWVDRLEATIESHTLAAAQVREACTIPGTSSRTAWLCRDKPSMKEALRAAGVPTAASTGADTAQQVWDFADAVGYPLILKPRAGPGRSTPRASTTGEQLEAALGGFGAQGVSSIAVEEFVEGHEGFYDTLSIGRSARARLRLPLLPERPRGDADPVDLAPVRVHQPRRVRGRLRPAARDGRPRQRGAGHRHQRDPHGVVLRAQGTAVLRDRLPPTGRRGVGPVRRRQRPRHLPRVGQRRRARACRRQTVAGASPPASWRCVRNATATSPATAGSTRSRGATASGSSTRTFPDPGTPTQPPDAGYMANAYVRMRHPDYDALREHARRGRQGGAGARRVTECRSGTSHDPRPTATTERAARRAGPPGGRRGRRLHRGLAGAGVRRRASCVTCSERPDGQPLAARPLAGRAGAATASSPMPSASTRPLSVSCGSSTWSSSTTRCRRPTPWRRGRRGVRGCASAPWPERWRWCGCWTTSTCSGCGRPSSRSSTPGDRRSGTPSRGHREEVRRLLAAADAVVIAGGHVGLLARLLHLFHVAPSLPRTVVALVGRRDGADRANRAVPRPRPPRGGADRGARRGHRAGARTGAAPPRPATAAGRRPGADGGAGPPVRTGTVRRARRRRTAAPGPGRVAAGRRAGGGRGRSHHGARQHEHAAG